MFDIVLYNPEIPPNTGNVIRLASNTGCRLHLIEPLGFTLEDRKLRRAGLDYHEYSSLLVHADWEAFLASREERLNALRATAGSGEPEGGRVLALSTRGERSYADFRYEKGDYLLFGPESRGLPEDIRLGGEVHEVLRLPMRPCSRSLNLSNAVAVVVYEAWRQMGFAGGHQTT